MITFAIFHYDIAEPLLDEYIPYSRGLNLDFYAMIDLAFRSAELFHPGCHKVVLTDLVTDGSRLPPGVRIVRRPVDQTRALFDRTAAYRDFVANHDDGSHVILLDSDILITNEFESSFDGTFDVGLTYRSIKAMPLNGGLIAVSGGRTAAAVRFFDVAMRHMHFGYSIDPSWLWLCDQFGLIEAAGRKAFWERTEDRLLTPEGVTIRLWPCATHNHSMINEWRAILGRDPQCRALHFKGGLKRLMAAYWSMHLDPGRGTLARMSERVRIATLAVLEILGAGIKAPDQLAMRLFRAARARVGRAGRRQFVW